MTVYNKLVRDKIPEMIRAQGQCPITEVLPEEEYRRRLEAKLDEEVREYHESKTTEELADILEVLLAINTAAGGTTEELLSVYREKHQARGGFERRILLIGKE